MDLVKAAFAGRLWLAGMSVVLGLGAGIAHASDKERDGPPGLAGPGDTASSAEVADAICLLIESAATANGLPVSFFTRLIGQESSFRTQVEGPVTRSGERAQGIAQFMPGTAAERGLLDPFDPVQALPRSAEFLKELRDRFGNLGLAAAAYNGGPKRVENFLSGSGGLPWETRDYVLSITGHPVEDWVQAGRDAAKLEPAGDQNCAAVRAMLGRPRSEYVEALERRVGIGVTQPWGVQLSAGFSKARALMSYDRAEKRFGAVLAGHDPMIIRSLLRSRGTRAFYQVRAGAPTRDQANALCTRLRQAGGACLVLRTGRAPKRA
jgi:hypothetical protein